MLFGIERLLMDKQQQCPVLALLLICTVVGGGMGAVLKVPADYRWLLTEWSQCSASCGGLRVRSVYCVNSYGLVSDGCQSEKPPSLDLCNLDKCLTPGLYPRHLKLSSTGKKETSIITSTTETSFRPNSNKPQPSLQTSTMLVEWTVSEWSECSATCDGGFRVRSVRCLDECGVISPQYERCNTSKDSRPSTYEFCAQIDCDTGIMDEDILPPNGQYSSPIPDGSFSALEFMSTSTERYQVSQNITESDGTLTILMETVMDGMVTFSCQARPVDVVVTVGQSQGRNLVFINGEFLFELDCIETTIVEIGQPVTYDGSTVTVGGNEFMNIDTFWYCDSFRCYMFNSSKSSFERSGPTSKLFTSKNVALYSIDGQVNSDIEDILLNPPPIITSESGVAPTPTPVTSLMLTTSSILFTRSLSSVMSAFITTSVVALDTSSIALSSPMSQPSSFMSPVATAVRTSLPSRTPHPTRVSISPSPTQVNITVIPTATPSGLSPTIAIPSLTPISTVGLDTVDPTRDETLCPRQTPKSKPRTKKRKKSRYKSKTSGSKKGTGDDITKTFKSKTKWKSKLRKSRKRTGGDKTKGYTFEKTKCPPEKTTDPFTKGSTRRRTMRKSRSSKLTRSKSSKSILITGRGSKTGSRTRIKSMVSGSRRRVSLSKVRTKTNTRTQSKEKLTFNGILFVSKHDWWYCSNLPYLVATFTTTNRYHNIFYIKQRIKDAGELGCHPGMDCRTYLETEVDLQTLHSLQELVVDGEKSGFICFIHPENLGQLLVGYQDVFTQDWVYLVALIVHRNEDGQERDEKRTTREETVYSICCIGHEQQDSDKDPT